MSERLQDIDELETQKLPEELALMSVAAMAQKGLAASMHKLTPSQQRFLRYRAMAMSDVQARHLGGRQRKPARTAEGAELPVDVWGQDPMRPCKCSRKKPGWTDLTENMMLRWKKQEHFMRCYTALIDYPILYAATRMEQLTTAAVQTYAELLINEDGTVNASVRRLASKDVLTAAGMMVEQGTKGPNSAVENAIKGFVYHVALSRMQQGLELSAEQRAELLRHGHRLEDLPAEAGTPAARQIGQGTVGRSEHAPGGVQPDQYLPD